MNPPNEQSDPGAEKIRGMVDPRVIHPSPDGLFPDSDKGEGEPTPETSSEPAPREEDPPGIIDPRREAVGPDL